MTARLTAVTLPRGAAYAGLRLRAAPRSHVQCCFLHNLEFSHQGCPMRRRRRGRTPPNCFCLLWDPASHNHVSATVRHHGQPSIDCGSRVCAAGYGPVDATLDMHSVRPFCLW
jgi:hypothetical protein